MPAFITGLGLVSALGENLPANWEALLAGQCIMDHSLAKIAAGGQHPRVIELALVAAREAVVDAGWVDQQIDRSGIALVTATSRGAIDTWLTSPPGILAGAAYGLSLVGQEIHRELGLGGPILQFSSACGTGLHALIRAAMMIECKEATKVLVVAAESSMHPLFAASFRRLGILSSIGTPCRPFDKNRQGFLMSEAAAAICLETLPRAGYGKSGKTMLKNGIRQIGSFALGADGHHLTAPRPDGSTIRTLLAQVGGNLSIDLIHAHGTGTELNDDVELAAIDTFAAGLDYFPAVYSHKGAIGHTLGAAGLIGSVLTCEMMNRQILLPNAQTIDPLPTKNVRLPKKPVQQPIRRAIVLAAGFGGAQAVVRIDSSGEPT